MALLNLEGGDTQSIFSPASAYGLESAIRILFQRSADYGTPCIYGSLQGIPGVQTPDDRPAFCDIAGTTLFPPPPGVSPCLMHAEDDTIGIPCPKPYVYGAGRRVSCHGSQSTVPVLLFLPALRYQKREAHGRSCIFHFEPPYARNLSTFVPLSLDGSENKAPLFPPPKGAGSRHIHEAHGTCCNRYP